MYIYKIFSIQTNLKTNCPEATYFKLENFQNFMKFSKYSPILGKESLSKQNNVATKTLDELGFKFVFFFVLWVKFNN